MDKKLGYYRYGITGAGNTKASFAESLQYGVYEVKYWICSTVDSLKMLVMRKIGMDQLSGPVGIVNVVADAYQQTKSYGAIVVIEQFLYIGILLSANLGVMNLLSTSGTGRRKTGVSLCRSNPEKEDSTGERRLCAWTGIRAFDAFDGVCIV